MKKFLEKHKITIFFTFLLIFLSSFIFFKNYVPGTWFTGWDNLHPEFNFKLNFHRALNAVWQENQGLGLLSGMSHSTDLPRILILFPFSFIFPLNFLRYFYFYLMLLIGPIGAYFLFRFLFKNSQLKSLELTSLLTGIFYLLNIGTLLNFYAPISFFSTQYGFLPWLVLYFLKFIREKNKYDLLIFIIISFFASQMSYVATLFIVYLFVLFILTSFEFIRNRSKETFKRIALIFLVIFLVNSYWLLPFSVFAFKNSGTVINSKISKMSSESSFEINKKNSGFINSIQLKGFWFENIDMNEKGQFVPMFESWNKHLANKAVSYIGYTFGLFVILGLILSFKKSNRLNLSFSFLFLFSLFMLMNENAFLGFIFAFIRNHSSIFREIFRFTYTKFSILGIFSFSIMFGIFCLSIINFLYGKDKKKIFTSIFVILLTALMISWMFPVFKGDLFYSRLRIKIPNDYFELFDWLGKQDKNTRIANFPQHTFWSWKYYNWGYRGSGFLWYGIEQPILDRAFDVWSIRNEAYYNEISQAIYSENPILFNSVLHKYGVNWVLLDKNVISSSSRESLDIDELEILLTDTAKYKKSASFGNIDVYSVISNIYDRNYLKSVSSYKKIGGLGGLSDIDNVYLDLSDYVNDKGSYDLAYPFSSLGYDNLIRIENKKAVTEYFFNSALDARLEFPKYSDSEKYINSRIYASYASGKVNIKVIYSMPEIFVDGKNVSSTNFDEDIFIPFRGYTAKDKFLLEFNDQEFIPLDNLTPESKFYGDMALLTKINKLVLLKQTGNAVNVSRLLQNKKVVVCSDSPEDSFAKNFNLMKEGTVALGVKNVSGCLNTSLNKEVSSSVKVVQVNFNYKSSNFEKPGYCLFNVNSNTCLNRKYNFVGYSKDWKNVNEYVDIKVKGDPNLEFGLVLEGYKSGNERFIEYGNVSLNKFEPISEVSFEKKFGSFFVDLGAAGYKSIKIVSPLVNSYNSTYLGAEYNYFNEKIENCSKNLSGKFSTVVKVEGEKKYVQYQSSNSNPCDFYNLGRFDHETSYLVSIENRNVLGLPLEFCFGNPLKYKCVNNSYLRKSKDWNSEVFIIRNQDVGGRTYSVGLFNTALGYDKTQNDLVSVLVFPFPANWVSGIRILSNGNVSEKSVTSEVNGKKTFEWLYKINNYDNRGVLVLNQSYDNGWIVFCGFKACNSKHLMVNNWANGWTFDSGTNVSNVYIVFWPQLLEYLGLALLVSTLLIFLYKGRITLS